MTLPRATLIALCLACLVAVGGVVRGTGWPGVGEGHTLVFHELRLTSLVLFGRDIDADQGEGPMEDFAALGAAHAGAPAVAGAWGGYQGYLADLDGHIWSGMHH